MEDSFYMRVYTDYLYSLMYAPYNPTPDYDSRTYLDEQKSEKNQQNFDTLSSLAQSNEYSPYKATANEKIQRKEIVESFSLSSVSHHGQDSVQDQLYSSNLLSLAYPPAFEITQILSHDLALFVRNTISTIERIKQANRKD